MSIKKTNAIIKKHIIQNKTRIRVKLGEIEKLKIKIVLYSGAEKNANMYVKF